MVDIQLGPTVVEYINSVLRFFMIEYIKHFTNASNTSTYF